MNEIPDNERDNEEELRLENEILKMNLKLKFGGSEGSFFGGDGNLPPEIENEFLKQVMAFEDAAKNKKNTTVGQKLGFPKFEKIEGLPEKQIAEKLKQAFTLLENKNIFLDITQGPYANETIYRFITEELINHEMDDIEVADMKTHFIYEEFHPNHNADLANLADEFFTQFWAKNFSNSTLYFANELITDDKKMLKYEAFQLKIQQFFDSFDYFENGKFQIHENKHHISDEFGIGHVTGPVKYTGVLENGEKIDFYDGYIIYFQYSGYGWEICSFSVPGFELS